MRASGVHGDQVSRLGHLIPIPTQKIARSESHRPIPGWGLRRRRARSTVSEIRQRDIRRMGPMSTPIPEGGGGG